MFSGFYTAASGMLMNQRSLDMAANNIANVKTSGYKPKRLIKTTFDQQLVRQMNEELAKTGCITISGRIDRKFFHEKFYGTRTETTRKGE